jgi:2-haloacid dehalogenase
VTVQPSTVIFDLGGVLIDWNPRYLYRKLFAGDDEAMEAFLAEVTSPAWNAEQDAGRTWREAVDALAAIHPDRRDLIAAYDERWEETLGDPIEGTVEILAELRAGGLRLAALSNWSAEKFLIARPRYPFLDWFETIVISGEVRVSKPDPGIFRHVLERLDLDAEACVFIDDSAANVEAAADLGMTALQFRDPATLRADLRALGLLPAVNSRPPPGR